MAIALTGKICVVTGAAHGVGLGLARGFANRGATVVAAVRELRDLDPAPIPLWALPLDVTHPDAAARAVERILSRHGRIDVWINNAGVYPRKPADEMAFDEWREVLDINLDGAWRCCQAVIPVMKRNGRGVIINVGSVALRLGLGRLSHYLASKGGLVGLTRGLARDLGPHGIRVNCVHLGAVRTEGELELYPDQEALRKAIEEKQSLRGRMTPETVEPVFAFLASDESADITGQCLTVDRGWSHD